MGDIQWWHDSVGLQAVSDGLQLYTCSVGLQAVSDVGDIQWWHDNHTVSGSERVRLQTSSSPSPAGSPRSQLHVRRATFLDSGLYTCGGPHVQPDSVQVMVTEGQCRGQLRLEYVR